MTWWKGIANAIAHGDRTCTRISWHCEACGGREFDLLDWTRTETDPDTTRTSFAIRCQDCGRVEVNLVVSWGLH